MSTSPPIAIVGMSSLFAGSQDLLGFWRDIVSATDRLTDVPPHAWLIEDYYDPDPSAPDMTYAKRGGYLDPVAFNPMEFGMPPTTIPAVAPGERHIPGALGRGWAILGRRMA